MTVKEDFPAFTILLHYCRPKDNDHLVYSVDGGEYTDFNLVLHSGKFEEETLVGEPSVFIISKEWVLENIDNIVGSVSDAEIGQIA